MLPLVCNDAVAILFLFDLSRRASILSIKDWYRQARSFNKVTTLPRATLTLRDYGYIYIYIDGHSVSGGHQV